MARLIAHGYGHFRAIVEGVDELRELARRAGLKIATECRCGKCGMGSFLHGFVDGEAVLTAVERSKHPYPHREVPEGLYLVSKFGHFPVSDSSMLAAVCTPWSRNRRGEPVFEIGLNFRAGTGEDIPEVAHRLARLLGG